MYDVEMEESPLFKNEHALLPEYVPEMLPHREAQIEEIAKNLEFAAKWRRPQNMFIFGPPGIGKTAVTKFVFRKLESFGGGRVKTVYINTWDYNTSAAILAKLILDFEYFIPRRGLSRDEMLEKLVEVLRKSKKALIVCLDEVDQLVKKDESALYELLRLDQYVENPLGLVMISNYSDVFVDIEPRIKSSLCVEEIQFKPYTLQEMKDILTQRCKEAFRPGVVEEGVALLCANHAVTRGGDVRIGLECLRKAAKISELEGSEKLKVEHVKKVLKDVKSVKLEIMRSMVKGVEKNIIELLKKKDCMLSTELWNEYKKEFGNISQTALRTHLKHLESIGLIKIRQSRRVTRGRKCYISLVKRKVFK